MSQGFGRGRMIFKTDRRNGSFWEILRFFRRNTKNFVEYKKLKKHLLEVN